MKPDQRSTDEIMGNQMSRVVGVLNTHARTFPLTFNQKSTNAFLDDLKKLESLLQQFTTPISQIQLDLRVVRDGLQGMELT